MKAVYAVDLHSDRKQYEELHALLRKSDADLLLMGGDLLAHSGSLANQLDFIEREFVPFARSVSVPILIIHGNIEWTGAVARYDQLAREKVVSLLALAPVEAYKLTVSGYGMSNPSPFSRKDFERIDLRGEAYAPDKPIVMSASDGKLSEIDAADFNRLPSIEEELEALCHQGVWLMHAPPYETKLDAIRTGIHVGSKAIRKRIEQVQPALTLHGHIHESPYVTGSWIDKIGRTVCLNPGRGDALHAVLLEFHDATGRLAAAEHTVFGKASLD